MIRSGAAPTSALAAVPAAPIPQLLAGLTVVLAAAALGGALARKLRQPAVMGEIAAGIALGPSLLGLLPGDPDGLLFPAAARPYLQALGQVGLALFMFGVGYSFNGAHLRSTGRRVAAVATASLLLPFGLGMGAALALPVWLDGPSGRTRTLAFALFLGVAMSITAFPVLARIIADRGLKQDPLAATSLACAALQDSLAWCALALVIAVADARGPASFLRTAGMTVLIGAVLFALVRPLLKWALSPKRHWHGDLPAVHGILVSGLLLSAWATDAIGLDVVLGAFAFGMAVPRHLVEARAPLAPERIEQAAAVLLPAYFTVSGLSVNLAGLGGHGLAIIALVTAIACAGKFGGATSAARLTGAPPRDALVLGVLLNTRGLTEIVILGIGLRLGVLDPRLFTAMVAMAVLTTVMAGPCLSRLYPPAAAEPFKA
jgi:Kef-type K+ transport system membrane component KefB